jgi:hypothetical protein
LALAGRRRTLCGAPDVPSRRGGRRVDDDGGLRRTRAVSPVRRGLGGSTPRTNCLRGGDVRLPFVAYVGPSATDDRIAWFDGVPVGGEATMVLRAGRTVSGRLIGLPSTTGGRPQFEFEARAQGVTGLTVVGTLRGDRYEFRGLPDGTRWDLFLVVTTSGPDGRSDRYASAEGVAAGADLDLTLRAP